MAGLGRPLRTGRAGGSGTAISLVTGMERTALLRIGKRFSINLQERPRSEGGNRNRSGRRKTCS